MSFRRFASRVLIVSFGATSLLGCGSDDEKPAETPPPPGSLGSSCDPDHSACKTGLVCEEAGEGAHRCYDELVLRGQVEDAEDGTPIEGARVMAVDQEGSPVTDVAETDADGHYELAVPAARNADGAPASVKFTLRAAAQDYQAFPQGARVALPIDARDAVSDEGRFVLENALTTIDLIGLPDGDRSLIAGSIHALSSHADAPIGGVLVVASGADGAVSGLSDKTGAFEIFNVPVGEQELKAYGAGIQIEGKSVSFPAACSS
jgi:hypothetical protein